MAFPLRMHKRNGTVGGLCVFGCALSGGKASTLYRAFERCVNPYYQNMDAFAKTPNDLWNEIRRGVQALDPWLKFYQVMREEFAGSAWPGVRGTRPVNLAYEMVTTITAYTSVPKLRSNVTALNPAVSNLTKLLEHAQNQQFEEMDLAGIIEEAAEECMFAPIAIVDVGRQEGSRTAERDGRKANVAECYARVVPLADLTVDPEAISWRVKRFCGHRITITRDRLREMVPYGVDDPEAAFQKYGVEVMTREEATTWLLKATDRRTTQSETGIRRRQMKDQDLQGVRDKDQKETDEIDLWRVAIYDGDKTHIVYTIDGPSQPSKFLHIETWQEENVRNDGTGNPIVVGGGSPDGPFKYLSFQPVRYSLLGLPALATIYDLHEASVKLSSKFVNQLLALKNLLLYSRDAASDAARVARAKDLDSLAVTDASKFTVAQIGGTRQELSPGINVLGEWFGNMGGGIRQIGGTSESATTATAASYLQNGATMRLNRFRARVQKLTHTIAKELAFLGLFADPESYRVMQMQLLPGVSIPIEFNRANIMADAMDFNFELEPFSAPVFDPMQMSQRVTQFLGLVTQSAALLQMGIINPQGLARVGRQYYGIDEVDSLFNLDQMTPQYIATVAAAGAMHQMPAQIQQAVKQQSQGGEASPKTDQPPSQRGLQSMGGPRQANTQGE